MSEQFDNDFSQTGVSQQGETKPLDLIILDAIDSMLRDLHVAMPGKVVAVRNNSFVDVQPLLQRKFKDGTLIDLPVVQEVPLKNLSGEDWWIKPPVAVGDIGTLLFHERSLDNWKVSGGSVDPSDPRRHDLSDAEFIPGLRPKSAIIPGAATEMILHNGSAEIILQKAGKFKITNGSQELIDLIDQLIQRTSDVTTQLSNTVTDISTGPVGVSPGAGIVSPGTPIPTSPTLIAALATVSAQLATISTQLTTLKTNLETLKGS